MSSSPRNLRNSTTSSPRFHQHHRHAEHQDSNPLLASSTSTPPPPPLPTHLNESQEKNVLLHAVEIEPFSESSPGLKLGGRYPVRCNRRVFIVVASHVGYNHGPFGSIIVFEVGRRYATRPGEMQRGVSPLIDVVDVGAGVDCCRYSGGDWQCHCYQDFEQWGVASLAGVLITAFDCFIFLFLENYGIRKLEAFFAVLITCMAFSFAWMFFDTKPSGKELMKGLVVPKLSSETIPKAIGVVGFYGTSEAKTLGLVNAGEYLQLRYGGGLLPILYIWGIGLLAAGQSSTISGTYAGQFIMGGFLDLQIQKWLRSLITRSCAILPTIVVAIVFNRSEELLDVVNEWLNVLQAVQIPFAVVPLLHLVSSEQIMGAFAIGTTLEVMHSSLSFHHSA
ncbi:UNVERIFIED_CONTAM: Metal transporter Nramp2 [Sesamum calycinum]|uniref:Metal transporter Nramp2 n=1 Tax=Sesamum calycinum TaxID=2727403 RepID=A0AAW2PAP2_9LAMI